MRGPSFSLVILCSSGISIILLMNRVVSAKFWGLVGLRGYPGAIYQQDQWPLSMSFHAGMPSMLSV